MSVTGNTSESVEPDFDAVIAGAGFAGLGMLHALRLQGLSVKVYDRGRDIGGTWYWNRYPGARTDSESYYYCFTFSDELLQDWGWSERYPGQPEVERYLNHVADRFDLRRSIQFNTSIDAARYDEDGNTWLLTTDQGEQVRARYFISAMGIISEPNYPDIEGLDSFEGVCHHTARWPEEGLELAGKRVGIIGSGATSIQLLPEVAEVAKQVTLFQRTPNHVAPARNKPISKEEEREIKANYNEIIDKTRNQAFAMPFFSSPSNRCAMDVSPEERQRIYEDLWQQGGFRFFFESFDDLLVDHKANETAAAFMRSKIGDVVKDPATVAALTPKNYPLFAKRPPLEHGYYQTFNRDNVRLVAITETPIKEITATGVLTSDAEYEFDVLVLATGFDAVTGAIERVDLRGRSGEKMQEKWRDGPETLFGISSNGFPNFFMITGPQSPFANIPTLIEENIDWIAQCIEYMRARGLATAESSKRAERHWIEHTEEVLNLSVARHGAYIHSWFMGTNVPGKRTGVLVYFGGADNYIAQCRQERASGFPGMLFSGDGGGA